ncbi:MAG TPA: hypothetical protein VFP93_01430 [Gammaproteobacteria bacterium]|nr:hypothetical protein [Gammaproteobacteria bacterium]
MGKWFVVLISFVSLNVSAQETRLYACKQGDGTVLVQDKPIDNCAQEKIFHYETQDAAKEPQGLREAEIKLLDESQSQQILINRYQNVDETVGNSLSIREKDRRHDNCYLYRSTIETALINIDDLEHRPSDDLFVRQFIAGLERDNAQHKYYCGQEYPQLKDFIQRYKSRFF